MALIGTGRTTGKAGAAGPAPYAIATSGSTGRPKVVLGSQESLTTLISWLATRLAITEEDRVAMTASPGFDAHLLDLWLALGTGAALVVPPRRLSAPPRAFSNGVPTSGSTPCSCPPLSVSW